MARAPNEIAIDRYTAVASVLAKVAAGMRLSAAIRQVARSPFLCLDGRTIHPSVRTLERWLKSYESEGMAGLTPASRLSSAPTRALPAALVEFLIKSKGADAQASIPEIIRRARRLGIIRDDEKISRVSMWRSATRLNLPIFASKGVTKDDMRRFAYAHRLNMVLSDGKKFRVGPKRRKRTVVTALDDATRFALCIAVGTSESASLFLLCLWRLITSWGLPDFFFLDNGTGFIARDVAVVCSRLRINLVFGTVGYPEGRGKIERYHRTLGQDLLRTFANNPAIDSSFSALELRIGHYLREDYNRRGHEALSNETPEARFLADTRPLATLDDIERVRSYFVVSNKRRVSRDNIVMIRRVPYEMPRGHAGRVVVVHRHLLDQTIWIIEAGQKIELARVDLELNAKTRRASTRPLVAKPLAVLSPTAATILFDSAHKPLVDEAGDCFEE